MLIPKFFFYFQNTHIKLSILNSILLKFQYFLFLKIVSLYSHTTTIIQKHYKIVKTKMQDNSSCVYLHKCNSKNAFCIINIYKLNVLGLVGKKLFYTLLEKYDVDNIFTKNFKLGGC